MSVDYNKYEEFVNAVTSLESKDAYEFGQRSVELIEERKFAVQRYLTAALGICAEAGEFTEIVKKIVFQGKPVNEDNIYHMKRELGDVMWYVMQGCMALDTSLDEIIEMNVEKLQKRYPGGEFDVHYSENRQEGDV
jgi:NTP pyrophosphatase (non-canonical NTP hydrolase)|tara:strand:- start:2062 stop:2469 length:408 start_codon:yes stop_codon:yes gene_type:complete